MSGARVLCFPEPPAARAVITKICRAARCPIVINPRVACDLAIRWDTNTFREPTPALVRLAARVDVWNLRCDDISKERVDRAFTNAFGYTSLIDPLTHRGRAVTKSNLNGAHDGVVVECPLNERDPDRIYQRLIGNESSSGVVEDIRTPMFGGDIPFVYLVHRAVQSRFGQLEIDVVVAEADAIFTAEERTRLRRFAQAIGMDYGELDVLRDNASGRLYVVDANPTPYGPPTPLTAAARRAAISRLAAAFDRLRRRRDPLQNRRRPLAAQAFRAASGRRAAQKGCATYLAPRSGARAPAAISVVVIARNEGDLVRETVSQLCDTLPPADEILVVDDGSDDGSTDNLSAHPRVQLIRERDLGVARARNLGAARSRGRVIVFADAHLTIPPGWCTPLLAALNEPRVGGAAPAISNAARTWERGYGLRFTGPDLNVEWLELQGDAPYAVPLIPWCFGAMRRDVFEATGGFDAGMIQWGSIDNEMSVRLWSLGYELRVVPGVEVAHVFRDQRPYPIEWMPVIHNMLRLAFVHFEADRVARVVRALGKHRDFRAAVSRAVAGGVLARRRELVSSRVHDTEWLFEKFGLDP
jgi:glycosyltransferase involved in cell wall biosynthesis